jgi:signal peptidase I
VTESVLLYLLFFLTSARLIVFLKPGALQSIGPVAQTQLKEGVDSIVWAGVVALLLIHFVVRSFYIPSGSMLPTLEINDFILVNELLYDFTDPSRGDIVVFHPPPTYTGDKTDLIKRVVGVENDKIEVKDGRLYINDVEIQEKFIKDSISGAFGPEVVKKGHVFVMGDNRDNSRDSRIIGQIPLENMVGRAEMIFYPPSRIRFFNFPR